MSGRRWMVVSMVGLMAVAMAPAAALAGDVVEVTFQQRTDNVYVTDYQGTDDAAIFEQRPDKNIGNYALAIIGRLPWSPNGPGRGLLRFDLSAMAGQYSGIENLTLNLWQDTPTGGDQTIDIFAISPANAGWVEGTKDSVTEVGSSSWTHQQYDAVPWAGSAGLGTEGTDYDPIPLATFNTGTAQGWVSIPLTGHAGLTLKDLIDLWSGDQANNPGLLIRSQHEGAGQDIRSWFASTEAVNIWGPAYDYPPQLVIGIPEPATLALVGLGGLTALGRRRR